MGKETHTHTIALFFSAILLFPGTAGAVQEHGGPGILTTHVIAHVIFLSSALFLILSLKRETSKSMGKIRIAGIFFALWNVVTLILHLVSDFHMKREGVSSLFSIENPRAVKTVTGYHLFQFSGNILEHVLLICAVSFMLFALRDLRRETL